MPALKALGTRDVLGVFYETLDRVQEPAWVARLGIEVPSDQESETYKMAWQAPAMRELVGGRQAKSLGVYSYSLKNKTYEATIEIAKADYRRDKTGQIDQRIADIATRARMHRHDLVVAAISAGSSATCSDGQDFFDDDHSTGDSGTLQNDIDASDVASLNVTTATAPTQAEASAAMLDVIGYMMAYLDEQGKPLNMNARRFIVLVPFNLYGAFQAAVKGNALVGASGAVSSSPIAGSDFNIDVFMVPELASSASAVFYIFREDGGRKPFILQEETPIEPDFLEEGSDEAFMNDRYLFGVKVSRAVGYGWWHYACKCTLS